jgi:hypothetical protein
MVMLPLRGFVIPARWSDTLAFTTPGRQLRPSDLSGKFNHASGGQFHSEIIAVPDWRRVRRFVAFRAEGFRSMA